jgi:hypothetical protein
MRQVDLHSLIFSFISMRHASSVGTATMLWARRQRNPNSILGKSKKRLCCDQTAPGAQPASYPIDTGGYFMGGKAAGA